MAKSWFRLKSALSYESMGAPKDRKKGEALSLYRFSGKTPVLVTNPVDQEYFRAKKELLIECKEDGTPIFEGSASNDYGASFAGRAISFQRFALAPKYQGQGAVSANTPGAPIPKKVESSTPVLPNPVRIGANVNSTPVDTTDLVNNVAQVVTPQGTANVQKSQDKSDKKPKKEKKFKCRGCGKGYTSRSGRLYHEKRCPVYKAKFAPAPSNA